MLTLAAGIGLAIMLRVLENEPEWIVGIVPILVGFALLVSAWLVRPKPENGGNIPAGGGR
jgi:putative Mn2+ efflux pump MntP